jgi:hypothetical protein
MEGLDRDLREILVVQRDGMAPPIWRPRSETPSVAAMKTFWTLNLDLRLLDGRRVLLNSWLP